jgi:hypothetical protein
MADSAGTSDHFPTTHATWIAERVTLSVDPDAAPSLARAARAELNAHVMQRYFAPLCAYVKGSAWRDFGEAADLVNGFFASRLERPEYLLQWRESGLALRRLLINGLLLHLHERARAQRRQHRRGEPVDPLVLDRMGPDDSRDPDGERAMDRAWAEAVVQAAVRDTVQELDRAGRAQAWLAFRRHFVEGVAYDALARETGDTVKSLKAQTKLVQRWLRASIGRVLQQDGVPVETLEAETDRLVALLLGS